MVTLFDTKASIEQSCLSCKRSGERPPPAEEDVAVLSVEVSELLLRQAGKLLPLQHESFHTIQILIPLLHQLFSLDRTDP